VYRYLGPPQGSGKITRLQSEQWKIQAPTWAVETNRETYNS
jgi:hypothetical protein